MKSCRVKKGLFSVEMDDGERGYHHGTRLDWSTKGTRFLG